MDNLLALFGRDMADAQIETMSVDRRFSTEINSSLLFAHEYQDAVYNQENADNPGDDGWKTQEWQDKKTSYDTDNGHHYFIGKNTHISPLVLFCLRLAPA